MNKILTVFLSILPILAFGGEDGLMFFNATSLMKYNEKGEEHEGKYTQKTAADMGKSESYKDLDLSAFQVLTTEGGLKFGEYVIKKDCYQDFVDETENGEGVYEYKCKYLAVSKLRSDLRKQFLIINPAKEIGEVVEYDWHSSKKVSNDKLVKLIVENLSSDRGFPQKESIIKDYPKKLKYCSGESNEHGWIKAQCNVELFYFKNEKIVFVSPPRQYLSRPKDYNLKFSFKYGKGWMHVFKSSWHFYGAVTLLYELDGKFEVVKNLYDMTYIQPTPI